MSPYEAWRSGAAVTPIRMPADPDELDVVCSEAVTCTLTTKGIQLENCMFNSDHLQNLLRRAPKTSGKRTVSAPVHVRVNRSLMSFIWVMDPQSKERLRVPNTDQTLATLSAYQISVVLAVRNKAREAGQRITISQAIVKARDQARDFLKASTQATKRRLLKLLALPPEASTPTPESPLPASPARRPSLRNRGVISSRQSTAGTLYEPTEHTPAKTRDEDELPSFRTVVRAPATLNGGQP